MKKHVISVATPYLYTFASIVAAFVIPRQKERIALTGGASPIEQRRQRSLRPLGIQSSYKSPQR